MNGSSVPDARFTLFSYSISEHMEAEGRANSSAAPASVQAKSGLADRAPCYEVPKNGFVCVEHPFRVQTHVKAVQSLGGFRSLEKVSSFSSNA